MLTSGTDSFDELRRRLGGRRLPAVAQAAEGVRLLTYLRGEGTEVRTATDIFEAVGALSDEEEIAAYRCLEGIAISHASDGWWLLFRYDEPLLASTDARVSAAPSTHVGDRAC
jgi:hypothetical protein